MLSHDFYQFILCLWSCECDTFRLGELQVFFQKFVVAGHQFQQGTSSSLVSVSPEDCPGWWVDRSALCHFECNALPPTLDYCIQDVLQHAAVAFLVRSFLFVQQRCDRCWTLDCVQKFFCQLQWFVVVVGHLTFFVSVNPLIPCCKWPINSQTALHWYESGKRGRKQYRKPHQLAPHYMYHQKPINQKCTTSSVRNSLISNHQNWAANRPMHAVQTLHENLQSPLSNDVWI